MNQDEFVQEANEAIKQVAGLASNISELTSSEFKHLTQLIKDIAVRMDYNTKEAIHSNIDFIKNEFVKPQEAFEEIVKANLKNLIDLDRQFWIQAEQNALSLKDLLEGIKNSFKGSGDSIVQSIQEGFAGIDGGFASGIPDIILGIGNISNPTLAIIKSMFSNLIIAQKELTEERLLQSGNP